MSYKIYSKISLFYFSHTIDSKFFLHLGLDANRRECPSCDVRPPPTKRKPPPEQEAATSTTPADASSLSESPLATLNKTPTQEWGIEEVIQFIESADPCLGVHADLFRKHVSNNKIFHKKSLSLIFIVQTKIKMRLLNDVFDF